MDLPDVHGHIAEIRRDEMAKAAEILGVEHHWLGFVDSGLPKGDPLPPLPEDCFALVPLEISTEALVRAVRQFRPHVMTTYDENGGYPHPDHIRCHQVSVAAFEAAADYRRYPQAGDPWSVSKLYYNHGFLRQRMQLLQDEFARNGEVGPFAKWLKHWQPDHDVFAERVTTRVECADYFGQRDDALRARHPDRPQRRLLRRSDRVAAATVAHGGVRAGPFSGAGYAAGDGPVRRDRGQRMNHAVLTMLWIVAEEAPRDTGPDFGKASPFGLLVIVLLMLGTFGLVWSMNRQLKKLPESFDPEHPAPTRPPTRGPSAPRPPATTAKRRGDGPFADSVG